MGGWVGGSRSFWVESGVYLQVNNNKTLRSGRSFKLRPRQHMQVKHVGDLLRLLH